MSITLSDLNKNKILDLQAKLKYAENKIKNLQGQKRAEVLVAEKSHDTVIIAINNTYDPQILSLQADISNLTTELEGVK